MTPGAGDRFRPQLELWPRAHRTGAFLLRYVDADGREADLDANELGRAIMDAGAHGDEVDWDTALGVARAAVAFLRHSPEPEPFTLAVVVRTVERALRELGLGRTARVYLRRQQLASAAPVDSAVGAQPWDTMLDARAVQRHARAWIDLASDDATCIDEVAADIHARIESTGFTTATPALVREFVLNELLARGLHDWADRIAHIALPVSDIEASHRGEATAQERAGVPSGVLSELVSSTYAAARILPRRVSAALARGDIATEGLRDVCRLERIALDLEGVKQHGAPDTDDDESPAPLTDPTRLARHISQWTRALAPHFSRAVRWNAVNFGYAPVLPRLEPRDYVPAAYALLFDLARGDTDRSGPRTELEICWDAPEQLEIVRGPDGTLVPINDVYGPARQFFSAALEAIEGLSSRETSIGFPGIQLTISPYFFGAPEASQHLDRIARTIANGFPLTLAYEPAVPLPLAGASARARHQLVAQTVSIDLGRALRQASGLNALLARLETIADDAVAAHLARHGQLVELARHRNGALGGLRRPWVDGPLLDPRALHYRVSLRGVQETPAHGDGTTAAEPERIDDAIGRVRAICDHWAGVTGRLISLAGDRPGEPACAPIDPRASLAAESRFHPYFAVPAPCAITRGESLQTPAQIAEFIRWAFLYTPCRALVLH